MRVNLNSLEINHVYFPSMSSPNFRLSGGSLGYWTACNNFKRYCTLPYCAMYRLWLHGLYGLYGPRSSLSPKKPINLTYLSLYLSLAQIWQTWGCNAFNDEMLWKSLHRRHNERNDSNHQRPHCPKKTSKLRVTGLCVRNSPVTREFPTQKASNGENVTIWWRHRDFLLISPSEWNHSICQS